MTRHISQVTLAGGRGTMPPSTTVHSGTQRLYKKFWGGYLLEEFSLLDAVGVLWGPRGGLCQRGGRSLYRGIAAVWEIPTKLFSDQLGSPDEEAQTYASFGVPTCHSCPHPCLQTRRTQSKKSFFGRKKKKCHFWTWGQCGIHLLSLCPSLNVSLALESKWTGKPWHGFSPSAVLTDLFGSHSLSGRVMWYCGR